MIQNIEISGYSMTIVRVSLIFIVSAWDSTRKVDYFLTTDNQAVTMVSIKRVGKPGK